MDGKRGRGWICRNAPVLRVAEGFDSRLNQATEYPVIPSSGLWWVEVLYTMYGESTAVLD